ncbi:MAG: succinylglutamate desuccinylase/aspartoacylase family protein [Verrucomicrobiota bacterium]
MSSTITAPVQDRKVPTRVRSVSDAIAPLEKLAASSASLVANQELRFEVAGETFVLPRYIFIGPQGGDRPIRVGIFAGIHGDEPEGVRAAVLFLKLLETVPEVARGYSITVYPVCNPTGYEADTRHARSGKDLNREFWKNSAEPEIRLLQAELMARSFDGIIALHTDDTSEGFYGIVQGATLTKNLIEPALAAAERILPRDVRATIDGFRARNGVITDCYEGVLSPPPNVRPRPFEIILETPKTPPTYMKDAAFVAALQTIFIEYRQFIAYASNI